MSQISSIQQELLQLSTSLNTEEISSSTSQSYDETIALNLINKIKNLLYINDESSFNLAAPSLESLLESSGIHYRRSIVLAEKGKSQPPIVFLDSEQNPNILYYSSGKSYIYSALNNNSYLISSEQKLPEDGYEVYAPLPNDMSSKKALIGFLLPVIKNDAIIAIILSILLTLLSLAVPWLTAKVVGDVVPSGNFSLLLNAFCVGLLITSFSTGFTWIQATYLSRINHRINQRLQVAVYDRITKLPLEFINSYSSGDFSSRAEGIQTVARSLSSSSLGGLISSISLVGYALLMFSYDQGLAWWSLGLVIIGGIVLIFVFRKILVLQKSIEKAQAEIFQASLQTIGSISQIRTNGSEPFAIRNWYKLLTFASSKEYNQGKLSSVSSLISEVITTGGKTILFAVIVLRLLRANSMTEGIITASTFIVFSATYDSLSSKFVEVVELLNDIFGSTAVTWQRALPILKSEIEKGYVAPSPIYKSTFDESLELRKVSFAYPNAPNMVFSDLSCTFKKGKFNAIFGPSGCGKSTLFNLILRFYEPMSGTLLVDGTPVDQLYVRTYRRLFGVILQKPSLQAGSIRDALSCGIEFPDSEIWDALAFANSKTEVEEMPMKLETILSEGASNISGGQRQRLAIARAILRKPLILIEDEATSALDNTSQAIISKNLLEAGITRIVVAHRVSSVSDCDHMIVLKDGIIESEGTFEQLKQSSPYLQSVLS